MNGSIFFFFPPSVGKTINVRIYDSVIDFNVFGSTVCPVFTEKTGDKRRQKGEEFTFVTKSDPSMRAGEKTVYRPGKLAFKTTFLQIDSFQCFKVQLRAFDRSQAVFTALTFDETESRSVQNGGGYSR